VDGEKSTVPPLDILTSDGPNLQKDIPTILSNLKPSSNFISLLLFCSAKAILAEGEVFFFLTQPSVTPFPPLSVSNLG